MPLNFSDYELVKENVMPLRQGRRATDLQAALNNDPARFQQQRSYEQQLRTYSGDDPLGLWYKYITWTEQNFYKGWRDGNLRNLIENCLVALRGIEKYRNDPRFWKVWRKFAESSRTPAEIYKYMFSNNFCCNIAEYYVVWSIELEKLGDWKAANEILTTGISCHAEPAEELQCARRNFDKRQAMSFQKDSNSKSHDKDLQERSAFTELKPVGKKHRAPISRVGENTFDATNRILTLGSRQKQPKCNVQPDLPFKIYCSANQTSFLPQSSEHSEPYILSSDTQKENKQKISKWSKVKVKIPSVPLPTMNPKEPSFTIYQDEVSTQDDSRPIVTPRQIPGVFNVLSTVKPKTSPLMALFEPPDPNVRAMYDRIKVYCGGEEFSFEELHAARWFAEQEKLEEERLAEEQERIKQIKEEELKIGKTEQHLLNEEGKCQLTELQEHMEHLQIERTSAEIKSPSKENLSTMCAQTGLQMDSEKNKESELVAKGYSSHGVPCNTSNIKMQPICVSSNNNHETSHGDISQHLSSTPTSHLITIEVHAMIQALYCGSTSAQQKDESEITHEEHKIAAVSSASSDVDMYHAPPEKKEKIGRNILPDYSNYCDSEEENIASSKVPVLDFSIYCDPEEENIASTKVPVLDFSIYCDPEEENTASTKVPVPDNECATYPQEYIDYIENIENICPADYVQKKFIGPPSGILQPSSRVLSEIPLFKELSDELEPHEDLDCNTTLIPPANTQQFAVNALSASTPCTKVTSHLVMYPVHSKTDVALASQETGSRSENILSTPAESQKRFFNSEENSDNLILTDEREAILNTNLQGNVEKFSGIHPTDIDPFDPMITQLFLKKLKPPLCERRHFFKSIGQMKHVKPGMEILLGNQQYVITQLLGEGRYAKVYSAEVSGNNCSNKFQSSYVALKVIKNESGWEFYICSEMKTRILKIDCDIDVTDSIMQCTSAVAFDDGIILVTDLCENGTLVDLVNFHRLRSISVPENVVMYLTFELLEIMSQIHQCGIIHGDIKPDNFLVRKIPSFSDIINNSWKKSLFLKLIDFGRSIDLHCMEPGTAFKTSTKPFACIEMREGRPWIFQGDWYGIAGTIHTLLFSEYMKVEKTRHGTWEPVLKIKRYWQTDLWIPLFHTLLNLPLSRQPPNVQPFIELIISKLQHEYKVFNLQLNQLAMKFSK